MKAACSSEVLVYACIYQTTGCHNSEDCTFDSHHNRSLKSQNPFLFVSNLPVLLVVYEEFEKYNKNFSNICLHCRRQDEENILRKLLACT
jgi:hypothetical protein